MPVANAESVLDALPVAVIAFKDGEAVWMNAEARRCGAHDPHILGAIRRALSKHPARIEFEGRVYALTELERIDAGTIVLLVPLTFIARLDPGAGGAEVGVGLPPLDLDRGLLAIVELQGDGELPAGLALVGLEDAQRPSAAAPVP